MAELFTLYESLPALGTQVGAPINVELSPELVSLLSENLYQSPLKAVEELVVNSYDAGASICRVFVPEPGDSSPFIVVFDNGKGMDQAGLADLWWIGRTKKRDEGLERSLGRKQIGKFGIGKLATYAIANQITYLSKADGDVLAVTVDFRAFSQKPGGATSQITRPVIRLDGATRLQGDETFKKACDAAGVDAQRLVKSLTTWTMVVLEDLKPKARTMAKGRLRWVLRTAMPLSPTFKLFLNGEEMASSKADYIPPVQFRVADMPQSRIRSISVTTGEEWKVQDNRLVSPSLPEGVSGEAIVTNESLLGGKSGEVGRSNGFFVMVRGRLVNEDDARFGLHELSHQTFNRFQAVVQADDLDTVITAPREGLGESSLQAKMKKVLNEVFNEARDRYTDYLAKRDQELKRKPERERAWVPERLVEYPVADALSISVRDQRGAEADDSWFYIDVDPTKDLRPLIAALYSGVPRTQKYRYEYTKRGISERLVCFNPETATFSINEDHELVRAYGDDPGAQRLLEDLVTGEALFEVYLRESGVQPHVIGEVLERRDLLLRGLANDRLFSLSGLSSFVLDSASNKYDLEVALVASARALGVRRQTHRRCWTT